MVKGKHKTSIRPTTAAGEDVALSSYDEVQQRLFNEYIKNKYKGSRSRFLFRDIEYILWSHEQCKTTPYADENENERRLKEAARARESLDEIYLSIEKLFNVTHNPEMEASISSNIDELFMCALHLGNYSNVVFPSKDRAAFMRKQRNAGKLSGALRAERASTTWEPKALELATKSRAENKTGSLDYVASFISENWPNTKIRLPGHTRLKQVVSIWITDGKLAPKI